ncbi:hypothetical protein [Almyronema epifaneia]|uniref:Uncharacterized protein n=1 Tax=Almyronema epifaneia S1 TaxID=2991925 RepID=A0ABW6IFD5_9CYAN
MPTAITQAIRLPPLEQSLSSAKATYATVEQPKWGLFPVFERPTLAIALTASWPQAGVLSSG